MEWRAEGAREGGVSPPFAAKPLTPSRRYARGSANAYAPCPPSVR